MARITSVEISEFHKLLDGSIRKLNSKKNSEKKHWRFLSIKILSKMLKVELYELDVAIECNDEKAVCSECDDIINYATFIKHNISKGQKISHD